MASFHKPKVFRSSIGCCICGAKSSSSRFTDSKRYESSFTACFALGPNECRRGEICNACVLLVKRYNKLPKGSKKHWKHVVDARANGNKANFRYKNGNSNNNSEEDYDEDYDGFKRKFVSKRQKSLRERKMALKEEQQRRKQQQLRHRDERESMNDDETVSGFLDMRLWKRERVCCGTIFRGPFGEVIIDPRFITRCCDRVLVPKDQDSSKQNAESNHKTNDESSHKEEHDGSYKSNDDNNNHEENVRLSVLRRSKLNSVSEVTANVTAIECAA